MKKTFILLIVIILPSELFSQNKQNKYYTPLRVSLSGISKFVMGSNDHQEDKYDFEQGFGLIGEVFYTIGNTAKYEVSLETGLVGTFSDGKINSDKFIIPVALNAYYYFFDEDFSPFLGVGFGIENFNNSNKYVLKPVVGVTGKKFKVFARLGIGNTIGNSLEIGIGYSFKERPCGCFPQSR
tara:strand:+ start:1482 stop:2027 length:546 start_codon:yes stop_codon:yes gene_type:complete